ncbi:DUF3857 domain-containing protein [Hymenobacter swuensis]|uniref:DUF3857 domain-containing protein n=1 Tax=Hymenobacter swuensis DY53 TaxID=1227739 RepID=W8F513_9BACT|nr:DUF3857 domain-containing protein [Hymenobacter swuensis]AHJ99127.1 hypothetical protein Hsw_3532 [Hymenobacter swuensis DY53]
MITLFKRYTPLLLAGLLLWLPATVQAQTAPAAITYAAYTWEAKRKPLTITAAESKQPAVVLHDFRAEEFAVDARRELKLYSVDHRIVRVNTSDGIERFNKIYLPVQDGGRILSLKARTISPRGEIVDVAEGNMKELKDEDGSRGYKVFAVEGVEKGSEIEYLFTRERAPSYFGRIYLQSEVLTREIQVELITPEALTFEVRRYPGGLLRDTVLNEKRVSRLTLRDVPALREEGFANAQAQRQRLEYKFAYSSARGRTRLFTWADASQFLYNRVYNWNKDELKAVDKLLKQMNLPATQPLPVLENYLKTNFRLIEDGSEANLTRVVTDRSASETGFARLFAALMNRLNIAHELVLTNDRSEAPFDDTFDTWNYLDHPVFYFPSTKQWLAPGRPDYRLPLIPAEWTANKGLFVRRVQLGSTETAVGKIGEIPTLTADQSPSDLNIAVQFAPNLDKSTVTIRETLGGYHAQQIQPFFAQIPEDKRPEVLQGVIKSNVPDAAFQKLESTNGETGLNPLEKPFLIDATVESVALLDRAGPKYLFKVGTLLGPQSELYQADERQFDVENDFNRRYNRTITFEVPAGYQVRNLQDLNFDVQAGPTAAGPEYLFKSSYEQQGQKVTVTIREYYRQIRWPKADFEAFRGVVNAAANFNKVVLVLEKKG